MEEKSEFLKYIYNEELYIIDEPELQPVHADTAGTESKEVVVENENNNTSTLVEEPTPISFFGNNEKGILILVDDTTDELLNQKDLDLLMKIIESGLHYSKNDFALVNVAKKSIDQILNEISYSYLISFGIDLSNSFSDTTPYTIHKVGSSQLLFSEPLSSMHDNKARKGKLWLALKSMFNIS